MEPALINDPALSEILEELVQLELHLHQPRQGTSFADLECMTAYDFWEVGASGRRYSRDFVLNELDRRRQHPGHDAWKFSDHHCRMLAQGIYLLTYTLVQDNGRITRRSTIWQRSPEGWKIVFHQGTVVQEP